MAADAWKRLLAGASAFRGEGKYFIEAYSEFVPPPRGSEPRAAASLRLGVLQHRHQVVQLPRPRLGSRLAVGGSPA
jgi:hypothetical protein